MGEALFGKHAVLLEKAQGALRGRGYWSAYPEAPSGKIYGESANVDGRAAFEARLHRPFELDQPTTGERLGAEESPYGFPLGITYPAPDLDRMLEAATRAMPAFRRLGVENRVGVCLEILHRLNRRSFELAYAVMHTSGQGFVMSFQAGGPHAQDRALEAVAYAYELMTRTPATARWEKPAGKDQVERLAKRYTVIGRGVGLVIGCSTFPTWNSYGAIFADLACGCPVIVKPHPRAVLPLALTVQVAREVLAEVGQDPNLVQLAVDSEDAPIASVLATRPEIKLVDYTGGSAFGTWLEENARQAVVFTEKAGVNPAILHSTADFKGLVRNLAFSLSLYSGQMCTTPQNIFVPKGGIQTEDGTKSFAEVAQAIATGIDKLLGDAERATEVLGCIQNPATLARIDEAAAEAGNKVLRASTALTHPKFPNARMRTPLLLRAEAGETGRYMQELFGPIAFVIETADVDEALDRAARGAKEHGAITALVHSTDEGVLERAEEAMIETGVALSENLTGGVFVNQSAAFSDFHATGLNPAANAALTDEAFVAPRFRLVQSRRPVRA